MTQDQAAAHGDGRSPWPAVGAIGGLLVGVAAIVGIFLDRGGPPTAPGPGPGSTSAGQTSDPSGPTRDAPSPDPSPDPGDDDTETASPPPGGDTVASEGSTVVPVGEAFDLDDDGEPDLAWDGFTVTWVASRIAVAPPAPTARRCRDALSRVPVRAGWVSTVGAMTPPEEDCVETSGGVVALAELAYDDASGGLAVSWTTWD